MKRKQEEVEEEKEDKPQEEQEEDDDEQQEGQEGGETDEGDEGEEEEDSDSDPDGFPDVSDADEDSDDDDGPNEEQIIVDFEFFGPKEIDFHGLKSLLTPYLDGQQYDCSGLVESIIAQADVGSVVKTSEDDDPFAIFTALNISQHAKQQWHKELLTFLQSKCSDNDLKQKLTEAYQAPDTGLLLTERLMNAPPKLAPPLLQFLMEEISEAGKDSSLPVEVQKAFQFKRYLVATRVYQDDDPESSLAALEAGPSSSKKQKKVQRGGLSTPVTVYLRPEDEYLHKHCTWSYMFPIEGRSIGKDDLKPLRMVLLIDSAKISAVQKDLDTVVGNMATDAGAMPPPQLPGSGKGKA